MSDDFKKLDDWMMDATKGAREQRVPEKDLKDFNEGVMKKIMERQSRPGFPYLGFAMMAAVSVAVIFCAVMYMNSVKIEKAETAREEAVAEKKKVAAMAADAKPARYASLDLEDDGKQFMSGSLSTASQPKAPALNESEIIDEIEALKELGAWTEDDEAEAGIPVDVTFSDMEAGFNNPQQALPVTAVQN